MSTDWLAGRLDAPETVVVDGSFYLPALKRDADAEYLAGHIPGAVRFDIDSIADHANPLPHMLPSADAFARDVGALGIADTDTIVVYDGIGLGGAPRVWWTFRLFGAEKVFILDGGLPKWKAEGRPTQAGTVKRAPRTFRAKLNAALVAGVTDVQAALAQKTAQVVDARPANRFRGEAPEPRPGLRSGHMPGALNVPSTELVEDGRLVAPERIKQIFAAGGVDLTQPIITSCGSGVTAATLWFALDAVGKEPNGAVRRLLVGMGRAQRPPDRAQAQSLIHGPSQGSGRAGHRSRPRYRPGDRAAAAQRRVSRGRRRPCGRGIEARLSRRRHAASCSSRVTSPTKRPPRARSRRSPTNSAGSTRSSPMPASWCGSRCATLTLAEWRKVLDTNLTAAFLFARAAEKPLRAAHGAIVTIASTRALMSEPDTESYSASKGGLVALTHALAVSLGPDVRVNCVSPGWIVVRREEEQTLRRKDHRQHPAGRVGRPEDIAEMVAFLLDGERSGFVTGANFVVDGGMTRKMIYEE